MANSKRATKKAEDLQDKAISKPSQPAPEVKDGLTERAESLQVNLTLNETELKDLETWIFDRMEEGFRSTPRRDAIARIQTARENYENGVPRDDKPFDNAHDVRLRWGAGQVDTFAVRISEGLFGQDPIVIVSPRSSRSVEKAPQAEKWFDWWHDEFWHLGDRGPDITDNVVREGHRILHMPYRLEIQKDALQQVEKRQYEDAATGRKRWVDIDSMDEMVKAIEDGLRPSDEYRVEDVKRDKVLMNGPDLEDLPFEDYVCPAWALPSNEEQLPWEGVRQWHLWDTIEAMEEEGQIFAGRFKQVQNDQVDPPTNRKTKGGDAKTGEATPRPRSKDSLLETWIWYGLYQLPGEKRLSRIMALVHVPTRTVLWARPRKDENWESACTHVRFLQVDWRFDGVSGMELFDSIEQAAQNMINYSLDETYMLAATDFTYRENRFDPDDHPLRPWRGLAVKSHNDIQFTVRQDRRPTDLNLMKLLLGFGEQRVNVGPYQQGQESSRNDRATARGIGMLLAQSSKLFNRAVRGQLKSWKQVFRKEMSMWQSTMPDYMAVDAVGDDGKALFPMGMGRRHIVGKFDFAMSGNVENVIAELDREVAVGLYDLFKDNPLVKASLSSFYNLTQDAWNSFKRKRKLLPPLEELQKKLNLMPTPPPLSSQAERELIAELKARKMTDEEIQAILKRVTAIPVDQPIAPPTPPPGPMPPVPGGPAAPGGPPPPPEIAPGDIPHQMLNAGGPPAPEDTGVLQ